MSSLAIPGSSIPRATLLAAASNVPEQPEWIVMNGRLQPMTFVQQLDHYQGSTLGAIADSAGSRLATLASNRHRHREIGWAGLGVAAAGAVVAALTPLQGVGIGLLAAGGATADFGLVSGRWDGDEMASTKHFVGELGEWGSVLSRQSSAPTAPAP